MESKLVRLRVATNKTLTVTILTHQIKTTVAAKINN